MSSNCVAIACGKKGAGKSTWLRRLVRRSRRLIVADIESRWELQSGDVVVYGAAELIEHVRPLADPRRRFRVVYRDAPDRLASALAAGPGAAYALRDVTLCIDELVWFCDARRINERLRWCLQVGRHRRVNVVGTTREPQEIHDLFFSQADVVQLFRTDPGNGLDRLARRYGGAMRDELPALDVGQAVTIGDAGALELIGSEGRVRRRKKAARGKAT